MYPPTLGQILEPCLLTCKKIYYFCAGFKQSLFRMLADYIATLIKLIQKWI